MFLLKAIGSRKHYFPLFLSLFGAAGVFIDKAIDEWRVVSVRAKLTKYGARTPKDDDEWEKLLHFPWGVEEFLNDKKIINLRKKNKSGKEQKVIEEWRKKDGNGKPSYLVKKVKKKCNESLRLPYATINKEELKKIRVWCFKDTNTMQKRVQAFKSQFHDIMFSNSPKEEKAEVRSMLNSIVKFDEKNKVEWKRRYENDHNFWSKHVPNFLLDWCRYIPDHINKDWIEAYYWKFCR